MSDIVLDEKALKELQDAGICGFDLEDEFKYTFKSCLVKNKDDEYKVPKKFWPVFTLRPIDGVELAHIEDAGRGTVSYEGDKAYIKTDSGKARLKAMQMGIVTWKNYRNEKGALIPPPDKDDLRGGITEESLRHFNSRQQRELSDAILAVEKLNKEELLGLE